MSSTPAPRVALAARERRISTGRLGPPKDYGRLLARGLCAIFALIGLVPALASIAARSPALRIWAAQESARLLHEATGVNAHYELALETWPLGLELTNVRVESSDGGPPLLESPRVSVTPRLFSLLAGRIGAGHIALEEPTLRLVVKDGKLANLTLETSGGKSPLAEPFSSLAITDAHVLAEIEGVALDSAPIDLDVFAEAGETFEVALRAAQTRVVQRRALADASGGFAVDDDVFCQLDLRVRLHADHVLVHRLSLVGAIDDQPEAGPERSCDGDVLKNEHLRVLTRVSGLQASLSGGELQHAGGHVLLQAPLEVMNRYLPELMLSGWFGLSGDVQYHAGAELPEFHGKVRTGRLLLQKYLLAERADADVHLVGGQLLVPTLHAGYADGDVEIEGVSLELSKPAMPLMIKRTRADGLTFPGLMRDVDVTPNTIVHWDFNQISIDDFGGTLNPPRLKGKLRAETRDFEVFDRAVHDPARRHMIGVRRAEVRGYFGVEPDSVSFTEIAAQFGQSRLLANVHIGFDNTISLSVAKGSSIDLGDTSPLVDIPMSGKAAIDIEMTGKMSDPRLLGNLSVDDLWFSGFPLGDVSRAKLAFQPLKVEIRDVVASKGSSPYSVSQASLDFGTEATLIADASVQSAALNVHDFFAMWHFDEDPRWEGVSGQGATSARIRYALGGSSDRCKSGDLWIRGQVDFQTLTLFDERYERAKSSFDFHWFDIDASYLGMTFDLPNLELSKGSGSILGSARIRPNARVNAELAVTSVPLSALQGLGPLGQSAAGTLSGVVEAGGSLDALRARAELRISPLRVGRSHLPASRLNVELTPIERAGRELGTTFCGAPKTGPFDPALYASDLPSGVFHASGDLFGGQIALDDVRVTRQRDKHVKGALALHGLDLAAVANLAPRLALLEPQPKGTLDAKLVIDELPLEDPARSRGSLDVEKVALEYGGAKLLMNQKARVELASGVLTIPGITLRATAHGGQQGVVDVSGRLFALGDKAELDLLLKLQPIHLSGLARLLPNAEQLEGQFQGELSMTGPLAAPIYRGGFELSGGALAFRGSAYAVSELDVRLGVRPGEVVIEHGSFSLGGGRVVFNGGAPLRGFKLGEFRAFINAEDVTLPLAQGVHASLDANLSASWQPSTEGLDKKNLPRFTGNVVLNSFEYSRPVRMSANITDLAQRGRRTEFDSYQPEGDVVAFDLNVRSPRPLKLSNNLIEAQLSVDEGSLQLAGTNQRFGVRGALRIQPGGRIHLRQNEFEIQHGQVRFEDPTRIAPLVDVTAVTEYRRYTSGTDSSAIASAGAGAGAASSTASGQWRIAMHAHGDAETLRVDLSSQPELSQDDIFLLLTFGLTRAELDYAQLDQSQSASLGESVALEALGTMTGADRAVTEAIPVIDEFRFGSAYSSRAGRTEPTITIGKRLSERIRAYVTSGITEAREVRSNVEVKINNKLSVQGSYDNVNDISSSSLGNLGADIRWRLDFE